MKLYEVPRNTKIRVVDEERRVPIAAKEIADQEVLMFHHIDGMYSLCHDMAGNACHLAAWTDVEIV